MSNFDCYQMSNFNCCFNIKHELDFLFVFLFNKSNNQHSENMASSG